MPYLAYPSIYVDIRNPINLIPLFPALSAGKNQVYDMTLRHAIPKLSTTLNQ
jgi:hypothetical protein